MKEYSRKSRRTFLSLLGAGLAGASTVTLRKNQAATADAPAAVAPSPPWEPNYLLSSCMYGYESLDRVVTEVRKTGATAIDLWPKVHGNQREQLDDLGETAFREMLAQHDISLGCITQYKLGPFGLQDEITLAGRFSCPTIVTGAKGATGLRGTELKHEITKFANKLKPHLDHAAKHSVTIAIENHGNNLIESPDSIRWLTELCDHPSLGIALAPYHLPQDPKLINDLIDHCGDRLSVFYAWQHGEGCMQKLPKEKELLQMPGRGELDFRSIMKTLSQVRFDGWISIFMHPVPRGIPILPSTDEVTKEINRARGYLTECLAS